MEKMDKKIILLAFMFFLLVPAAVAWQSQSIIDINPSTGNRYRDTIVSYLLVSNASSDYEVNCYMRYPNWSVVQLDGTKSGKLAKANLRHFIYTVEKEQIDVFGDYSFICNETIQGAEHVINHSIVPVASVDAMLSIGVYLDQTKYAFFHITPLNQLGEPYNYTVLRALNATLYKGNNSGKYAYNDLDMLTVNKDGYLEGRLDMSDYGVGKYGIILQFQIKGEPDNYTYSSSQGFYVRETGEVYQASSYLWGVVIALAFLSFVFAYLSLNIEETHAPLKWLFLFVSLMLLLVDIFTMYLLSVDKAQLKGIFGNSVLFAAIIILVFVVAYFLIYFLANLFRKITPKSYGAR